MTDSPAAVRVTALSASAQMGGTERVLLDFARHAFEYGIDLRVLAPRAGPLVTALNAMGVRAEVVAAPDSLLRGSQRPGHIGTLPGALLGLRRWARDLRAHPFVRDTDLLYSVGFKTHLAAAWIGGRPTVWHLHELPPAGRATGWRLAARFLPDALIANSDAAAARWRARGITVPAKEGAPPGARRRLRRSGVFITVIRNGVELDRFKPRERSFWIHDQLGLPRECRLIGMPAVFARWKGQIEVMRAFGELNGGFQNVHLVLVGGSIYDTVAEREYGRTLREAIGGGRDDGEKGEGKRDKGKERHRMHLLPFQQNIELVYPEFDVVVHYSIRPEPFGRVILEAMACGVPVIAAAEGGPLEILGERDLTPHAGWLVEPRRPHILARTLRAALRQPRESLRAMGAAGRRKAEDQFGSRAFAERVAAVLKRVAKVEK